MAVIFSRFGGDGELEVAEPAALAEPGPVGA
jgi:hypothetical protein